ncbi:MAG: S8 family serine peptidase [Cellulomonadaceae bacterium]|nr:S8 family serine peptidase [Cellulomonadaceae bacterium]
MLLAGAAALALTASVGSPAVADTSSDNATAGSWWYRAMAVAEVHAQGITGAGVTVAVIDGAINPDLPYFAGTDLRVQAPAMCWTTHDPTSMVPTAISTDLAVSGHGSNVVAQIIGNGQGFDGGPSVAGIAPDATVLFYGTYWGNDMCIPGGTSDEHATTFNDPMGEAVVAAVDAGADIISISLSQGAAGDALLDALKWAMHENVVVLMAVGNDLSSANGAVMNGVVGVNATDENLVSVGYNGYYTAVSGPGATIAIQGDETTGDWSPISTATGTSLSTPITAGALALVKSAYPEATGNQLIQTLLRNTGVGDHDMVWSGKELGYGLVGLRNMLAHDPTQYPDVNPNLLETVRGPYAVSFEIFPDQVAAATRPTWMFWPDGQLDTPVSPAPSASVEPSASASGGPATDPGEAGQGGPGAATGVPVWVLGALAALLAATAVAVAVVRSRSSRTRAPAAAPPPPPPPPHGGDAGLTRPTILGGTER